MRFYTHRHKHYCGIDLHTSVMYVCITDSAGEVLVHKNLRTSPEAFMRVIEPYREDLAVAVECVFVWYWPYPELVDTKLVTIVEGESHGRNTKGLQQGVQRRRGPIARKRDEDRPTLPSCLASPAIG